MDNADYLAVALRLAGADLSDLDALRAALYDEPWWADRLHEHDLAVLREVAVGLRRALDAMVTGDDDAVREEINALLAAHPPRPRLSGHGGR